MSLPTKEELSILTTFRDRVADVLTQAEFKDDFFLLRWLRARELNESDAEKLLRNAVKWRQDNKVDSVIVGKTSEPFFYENFPKWVDGVDREGRPVFTAPLGKWDVRKVLKEKKSPETFKIYMAECFEEVAQAIKTSAAEYPPETGQPPVTQFVGIADWKGFPWGQLFNYQAVQSLLQGASMYEAYYPEILHSFYYINCPTLISSVFTLLRPILAPRTMAKIKCFGTDRKVWEEELFKVIDPGQLRPQFGGTKDDVDDFYNENL